MDIYLEESPIELLNKTKLIFNAIINKIDKQAKDEIFQNKIKKKISTDLKITVKYLEFYIAQCETVDPISNEIQINIDIAYDILKLIEACLGTNSADRFNKYYNIASDLLLDLRELEKRSEVKSEI